MSRCICKLLSIRSSHVTTRRKFLKDIKGQIAQQRGRSAVEAQKQRLRELVNKQKKSKWRYHQSMTSSKRGFCHLQAALDSRPVLQITRGVSGHQFNVRSAVQSRAKMSSSAMIQRVESLSSATLHTTRNTMTRNAQTSFDTEFTFT